MAPAVADCEHQSRATVTPVTHCRTWWISTVATSRDSEVRGASCPQCSRAGRMQHPRAMGKSRRNIARLRLCKPRAQGRGCVASPGAGLSNSCLQRALCDQPARVVAGVCLQAKQPHPDDVRAALCAIEYQRSHLCNSTPTHGGDDEPWAEEAGLRPVVAISATSTGGDSTRKYKAVHSTLRSRL